MKQFDQNVILAKGHPLVFVFYMLLPMGLFSLWHLDSQKQWADDKELWILYIYLLLMLKELIEDCGLWCVKGWMGQDFLS